jgi:hypothetical protein
MADRPPIVTASGTVITWEAFERVQALFRHVCARLSTERWSGPTDEAFYMVMREAVLDAGATEREIHGVAAWMVHQVVAQTAAGSCERREQFDLIVEHLACASMDVALSSADTVVSVDFPDRPLLQ